ncbi:Acetate kinase [Sterolibacterium denitrificans]|uniref:Acetate kinase n=1 Tax=Sterolibacterium denitrificans TaxID=157592 RepID=A0A7Z7HRN4_9PROT|nr:acetate/propionate family kinase [Sterolibacterium denitrificans]SMB27844.1 Acetate kinase [Sterolibacterium denitrificans]
MRDAILVLNAGSSSIKFAIFELPAGAGADTSRMPSRQPLFSGQIDGIGADGVSTRLKVRDAAGKTMTDQPLDAAPADGAGQHRHALDCLLGWLDANDEGIRMRAVGHRVVHGGEKYARPIHLDAAICKELAELIPLAPLHQPHNLSAIHAVSALLPKLPQVACFDTAFHCTQPAIARQFALPRAITAMGVRRYGFHGISYEYIAATLPELLGTEAAEGRIIVAHLGNGASMCAMRERRSVATTMGFSSLDGLVMGTRSGNLDPGVLLYLMDNLSMDSQALARLLYRESGLLGVSGISQDMRTLLASPRPEAQEAIELFCYRVRREIGSLSAALGGLDALVFTGGIGEHAAPVREKICAEMRWLGVAMDAEANATASGAGNVRLSRPDAAVQVLVMPTNEEWMIARHTAGMLG